jgi:hypothetical protein
MRAPVPEHDSPNFKSDSDRPDHLWRYRLGAQFKIGDGRDADPGGLRKLGLLHFQQRAPRAALFGRNFHAVISSKFKHQRKLSSFG